MRIATSDSVASDTAESPIVPITMVAVANDVVIRLLGTVVFCCECAIYIVSIRYIYIIARKTTTIFITATIGVE